MKWTPEVKKPFVPTEGALTKSQQFIWWPSKYLGTWYWLCTIEITEEWYYYHGMGGLTYDESGWGAFIKEVKEVK